jgi:hypothetical protein
MSDDFDPDEVRAISLVPPSPQGGSCDAWGNIRGEPSGSVDERHDNHFVKLLVYQKDGRFYYGYQIKIGTMIKQKTANIKDRSFTSEDGARGAASIEVERVCNSNKNVKKLFAEFIRIRYNQRTLFEGVSDE